MTCLDRDIRPLADDLFKVERFLPEQFKSAPSKNRNKSILKTSGF
jgi:hypothetical protein